MSRHRLHSVLFIVLTALLLISTTVGAASMESSMGASPKDGAIVSLSTAQSAYGASEDVLVTVTISNPSGHSVRILKWFTPVEDVVEPVFAVKLNGEPVSYTGPIYKRPAPTGSDYLTLKSGESVSYSVNLGDYYDLSASGQYQVYYAAASYTLFDEKGSGTKNPAMLTSQAISLKIDGHTPKGKPTPTPTPPPGGTTYNACTSAQISTLVKARDQAKTYAAESENYLLAHNSGTLRYTEWFGTYDSSRYSKVSTHFTKLSDAWDSAGVNFDCSCKQNYYAYVYPTRPYNIYLCRVFWAAPLAGTDSQGGTLIHEMSHFNVVASTNDYVYGQTGARNLADTNPANAINNADNHEYFAENNPALP